MYNYSTARSKQRYAFVQPTIELIQLGEEGGILTYDNTITVSRYIFPIKQGILAKQHAWANLFMVKYAANLPEANRTDVINMAFALQFFYAGHYQSAKELLYPLNFSDPLISFTCRSYLLACIYETEGTGNYLSDYNQSFSMYLRQNNSINNSMVREEGQNLIYFLREMKNQKKSVSELIKEIQEKEHVYLRYWLIKKIEEDYHP